MRVDEVVCSMYAKKLPQIFQTFVMMQLISSKDKNSTLVRNMYPDVSYHFVSLKDLSQPQRPIFLFTEGFWPLYFIRGMSKQRKSLN